MSFGLLDEQNVCSRKQSASDLQSRLKTRKLLGVGELTRDKGEIYRSKISQLLGINESLYVRLPRGLLYWNTVNTLYFYLIGGLCVILPSIGMKLDMAFEPAHDETKFVVRIYGVALISFGLLFRSILLQRETRAEIATLLLVTALLHLLQIFVACCTGHISVLPLLFRIITIVGNIFYHAFVDAQGGVHRQLMRLMEDYCVASTPVSERSEKKFESGMAEELKSKDE